MAFVCQSLLVWLFLNYVFLRKDLFVSLATTLFLCFCPGNGSNFRIPGCSRYMYKSFNHFLRFLSQKVTQGMVLWRDPGTRPPGRSFAPTLDLSSGRSGFLGPDFNPQVGQKNMFFEISSKSLTVFIDLGDANHLFWCFFPKFVYVDFPQQLGYDDIIWHIYHK